MEVTVQPRCLVCGSGLAGQLHACPACETPHHRECWAYNGGCAVYGCGQIHRTAYARPLRCRSRITMLSRPPRVLQRTIPPPRPLWQPGSVLMWMACVLIGVLTKALMFAVVFRCAFHR